MVAGVTQLFIYGLFLEQVYDKLEGVARYAGQLLAPAESFTQGKKRAYYAVLAYFRPILVFSSNHNNCGHFC